MPEALRGKPAIEKRRLQNWMNRKIPFDSGREDIAPRLRLQVFVAADVVRVGKRVIDRPEVSTIRI
jgi:hypothetical protein